MKDIFVDTKKALAFIVVIFSLFMLAAILFMYGARIEILTLILGYVSGSLNNVLGVYFGATNSKHPPTDTQQTSVIDTHVEESSSSQ
jgi:hypothetical protein